MNTSSSAQNSAIGEKCIRLEDEFMGEIKAICLSEKRGTQDGDCARS